MDPGHNVSMSIMMVSVSGESVCYANDTENSQHVFNSLKSDVSSLIHVHMQFGWL